MLANVFKLIVWCLEKLTKMARLCLTLSSKIYLISSSWCYISMLHYVRKTLREYEFDEKEDKQGRVFFPHKALFNFFRFFECIS